MWVVLRAGAGASALTTIAACEMRPKLFYFPPVWRYNAILACIKLWKDSGIVDRQEQIDFIIEHYENPFRHGAIPDASVVQKGGNPGCGDVLTFYLKVGDGDRIEDISFEGDGCTISQAAASMVTEMFLGKTLEDVENTPPDVILDLLGRELASTRLKCATLGLNTTKAAVQELRNRQANGK